MLVYVHENGNHMTISNENLKNVMERSGFTLEKEIADGEKPLSEYTVKELRAMCEEKAITIPAGSNKEEIIALLG